MLTIPVRGSATVCCPLCSFVRPSLLVLFCQAPLRPNSLGQAVKCEFQLTHPCPANGRTSGAFPGYIKDHVKPLKCGGPDAITNMQWQTKANAKAKDKWETKGCGR